MGIPPSGQCDAETQMTFSDSADHGASSHGHTDTTRRYSDVLRIVDSTDPLLQALDPIVWVEAPPVPCDTDFCVWVEPPTPSPARTTTSLTLSCSTNIGVVEAPAISCSTDIGVVEAPAISHRAAIVGWVEAIDEGIGAPSSTTTKKPHHPEWVRNALKELVRFLPTPYLQLQDKKYVAAVLNITVTQVTTFLHNSRKRYRKIDNKYASYTASNRLGDPYVSP